MKRVLVLGANGMLGQAVVAHFARQDYVVTGLSRTEFDFAKRDHADLRSYVEKHEFVINAAGIIKPRIADNTVESLLRVNSALPRNLAKIAAELGKPCFHITTDCAYTGKRGAYNERDLLDADDNYGLSKIAGETTECMTLRTSIIGEERGQGRSLLSWAISQRGLEVKGFTNHRWNGLTTVYLAEVIEKILMRGLYKPGLFHIHSPDSVTKLELLEIFSRVYDLGLKINGAETPQKCDRTLASVFDYSKNLATLNIESQVRAMHKFFAGA